MYLGGPGPAEGPRHAPQGGPQRRQHLPHEHEEEAVVVRVGERVGGGGVVGEEILHRGTRRDDDPQLPHEQHKTK